LPLDLLVYEEDSLAVTRFVTIDEHNQYFHLLRTSWGQQLKAVFERMDAPLWDAAPGTAGKMPSAANLHSTPLRMRLPAGVSGAGAPAPLQALAEQAATQPQH
jgi:putative proteasome-type protease